MKSNNTIIINLKKSCDIFLNKNIIKLDKKYEIFKEIINVEIISTNIINDFFYLNNIEVSI